MPGADTELIGASLECKSQELLQLMPQGNLLSVCEPMETIRLTFLRFYDANIYSNCKLDGPWYQRKQNQSHHQHVVVLGWALSDQLMT